MAWSYCDASVGELALVFDLCDHADALEAVVEGAVLALTVDSLNGSAGLFSLPVVDTSPLSLALRGLAAHKLPPPAWRQRHHPARMLSSRRWAKTYSMADAERELVNLAGSRGVGTIGDAVFDQRALTAANIGAEVFDRAQPIVVSGELVQALPDWEDDRHAYQYGHHARLALPAVYLDLATKHGDPLRLGASERYRAASGSPPPWPLPGALWWQQGGGDLCIIPFGADHKHGAVPEPRLLFQFTARRSTDITDSDCRLLYTADEIVVSNLSDDLDPAIKQAAMNLLWTWCGAWITMILAVLYLLESANVSLRPALIHGKAPKRARAAGQQPSLVIHISSPAAPSSGESPSTTTHSQLSHRHWRRGNYAHYAPHTAIGAGDPDKLTWIPERAGYYRKVWRRPTIVGPANAPIRLKTRHWRVGPDPRVPG